MAKAIPQWLQENITQLEVERSRIEKELEAFRVVAEKYATQGEETAADKTPADVICDAMERILEEVGETIHRKDMLQRLLAKAVHVGGQDPINNVGAYLSKDGRFYPAGQGMWGLKKWKTTKPVTSIAVPTTSGVNGHNHGPDDGGKTLTQSPNHQPERQPSIN